MSGIDANTVVILAAIIGIIPAVYLLGSQMRKDMSASADLISKAAATIVAPLKERLESALKELEEALADNDRLEEELNRVTQENAELKSELKKVREEKDALEARVKELESIVGRP